MANLDDIAQALIKGDRNGVSEGVNKALEEGTPVEEILNKGLIAGMSVIGERFKKNEVYVPEVLIAARAMHAGMDILKPKLAESGVKPVGTIVLGTVKGDLHDIGKNLVGMMLQGGGFDVVDIGTDAPAEKFVDTAKEKSAQIIAMSALLTTTMPQMSTVVKAAKDAGIDVKTIIGGAPVTQDYANEIGADGYAPDAASAVDVCKDIVSA
jgi:5-methyltetrahydrofolate--homocysteine methyltransferase